MKARLRRFGVALAALAIATAIWLPCVHLVFARPAQGFKAPQGLSPMARALAARHLELWTDPKLREQELQLMRASNAEWDFMGRSFLVWSLANMGLRDPANQRAYLQTMDRIIDETLKIEKQEGMEFFLMSYAKDSPFVKQPARSLFVDGEIALMLGSRRALEEKPAYKALMTERINLIADGLRSSPNLMLESYPNECWTFDHAVALAAMRVADHLDGTDHSQLIHDWIAMAKKRLVHPESGLLVSSFTTDGQFLGGPQGSTIWMTVHCLQLVDEDFARGQYDRARKQLGEVTMGFGYAHEWPPSWTDPANIDSGPVIPVLNISPGSSGMAFIGASTFNDDQFLSALATTLDFAAFPSSHHGALKYCASNQVGDAALLYAATMGPLWDAVKTGRKL